MMDDLYGKPSMRAALQAIATRWPELRSDCCESPVFVLAAGWRSGSTMLQRMIMPHCFVWGEPYGHAGIVESLADAIRCFTDQWPEPHFFHRGEPADQVTDKFIANLYPQPERLLEAHLAFFDRLFAEPARQAGAARWGIKEVRWSTDHARYLKWLFPGAKFLCLIRNPYDAYRSFAARRNNNWKWYHRWPDHPISIRGFGRHWRELTASFLDDRQDVGGLLVRYEQLVERDYAAIEEYLGFELSQEAADRNPPDGGPRPLDEIVGSELIELDAEVHAVAARLGYEPKPPEQDILQSQAGGPAMPAGVESLVVHAGVAADAWSSDPSKCVILVPVGSHVEPACETALQSLERRGYPVRRVRGYAAIDQGRNQMATDALADGFAETMWIDADVGFDPDAVDRLRAHGLPIVCGIYPKKGKRELAVHVGPNTDKIVFGKEGGLIELTYAATGFLLVRSQVYHDIQHKLALPVCNEHFGRPMVPYFLPLVRPDRDGQWYLAEDFAFSERARQCGYRILADTTIRLSHYGNYGYSWEDAGSVVRRFATYNFNLKGESQ